jgi:hypothetical protein
MRHITLLLLLLLLYCSHGIAQEHKVTVKDSDGNVVPFAVFVSEKSGRQIASDNQGMMVVREGDFAALDTLVLHSIFYEPLSIAVGQLGTGDIVLTARTMNVGAVSVYPEEYAEKFAKKMANYFARNMAVDYAAKVTWFSTVEANGKYREFTGYEGLFTSSNFTTSTTSLWWNDKNECYWHPLTVIRSDALATGSDEVLEIRSVSSDENGILGLKTSYVNRVEDPWMGKRALELYSPLNPKQVRNFTYRITESYNTPQGEVVVLHFKSKPGTFPAKTKIIGRGYIHCLAENGRPIKVVTENIEDHYTHFIRTKTEAYPSVTAHRVEIEYGECEGKIYTLSIAMNIEWIDPGVEEGRYYAYAQPRRRNPIANRLKEYRYMTFTAPVILNKQMVQTIRENTWLSPMHEFVLTAPFERSRWDNVTMPTGIDREKLFRDLGASGTSLYEQAERNGMAIPEEGPIDPAHVAHIVAQYGSEEKYFDVMRNNYAVYHKIGREKIYPLLYGTAYE